MEKIKKAKKVKTKKIHSKSLNSISLYSTEGTRSGEIDVPSEIFDVTASDKLLAQYVRVYLANQRQGTNKVKTRSEVKGSTRKIYRQKGTGRARHGAKTAPIFVGGGVAHGPRLRSFKLKLNKKQRRKALYYSLTLMKKSGDILVLEGIDKLEGKAQNVALLLSKLSLQDTRHILCIYSKQQSDKNIFRATHNLHNVYSTEDRLLNAYDVLKAQKIIFTKSALEDFITFRGFSQKS